MTQKMNAPAVSWEKKDIFLYFIIIFIAFVGGQLSANLYASLSYAELKILSASMMVSFVFFTVTYGIIIPLTKRVNALERQLRNETVVKEP